MLMDTAGMFTMDKPHGDKPGGDKPGRDHWIGSVEGPESLKDAMMSIAYDMARAHHEGQDHHAAAWPELHELTAINKRGGRIDS